MTDWDIILNELAQGLRPMSQGIEWFDAHSLEEQADMLLFLRHYCMQARAVTEDGPESIRRAGLRPTHTPAVLVNRGPIDQQLGKIAGLTPVDERRKGVPATGRGPCGRRRTAPRTLLLRRMRSLVAQPFRRRRVRTSPRRWPPLLDCRIRSRAGRREGRTTCGSPG